MTVRALLQQRPCATAALGVAGFGARGGAYQSRGHSRRRRRQGFEHVQSAPPRPRRLGAEEHGALATILQLTIASSNRRTCGPRVQAAARRAPARRRRRVAHTRLAAWPGPYVIVSCCARPVRLLGTRCRSRLDPFGTWMGGARCAVCEAGVARSAHGALRHELEAQCGARRRPPSRRDQPTSGRSRGGVRGTAPRAARSRSTRRFPEMVDRAHARAACDPADHRGRRRRARARPGADGSSNRGRGGRHGGRVSTLVWCPKWSTSRATAGRAAVHRDGRGLAARSRSRAGRARRDELLA